jgi:hypothetical protein
VEARVAEHTNSPASGTLTASARISSSALIPRLSAICRSPPGAAMPCFGASNNGDQMLEANVFNAATLTRCIVTTLGINLCGALHNGVRVRAITAMCAGGYAGLAVHVPSIRMSPAICRGCASRTIEPSNSWFWTLSSL